MRKYYLTLLPLALLLISVNTIAQDKDRTGQLVQKSKLFKEANQHSEVVTSLAAKEPVIVKSRQRAWYFVLQGKSSLDITSQDKKTAPTQLSGWVSMLNVRFIAQAKREGELGFSHALSSMSQGTLPTVSTGVRGFDEDDLEKSQADFDQVERLNSFAVTKELAQQFAQLGNLSDSSSGNSSDNKSTKE